MSKNKRPPAGVGLRLEHEMERAERKEFGETEEHHERRRVTAAAAYHAHLSADQICDIESILAHPCLGLLTWPTDDVNAQKEYWQAKILWLRQNGRALLPFDSGRLRKTQEILAEMSKVKRSMEKSGIKFSTWGAAAESLRDPKLRKAYLKREGMLLLIQNLKDRKYKTGGHVYFAATQEGRVKIGYTSSYDVPGYVSKRLTWCPGGAILLGFCMARPEVERAVHNLFDSYRDKSGPNREWFMDCPEIRAFIAEVCDRQSGWISPDLLAQNTEFT